MVRCTFCYSRCPLERTRGADASFCFQGGSGRINDLSLEQWRKIQSVNYDSVFYAMKAVGPIFEQQGSGSFIATTSISAHIVNVPLDQVSSASFLGDRSRTRTRVTWSSGIVLTLFCGYTVGVQRV